jgi:hypothetical protein
MWGFFMATPTQINMITNLIRTSIHNYNELEVFLDYVASMITARESGDCAQLKADIQRELSDI